VAKFELLFSPLRIGNMEVPNRLVMLPMGTGFNERAGRWNSKLEAFLEERAKGGVGLIISPFYPSYIDRWVLPGIYEDKFITPLRNLAKRIHDHGSKFVVQLVINEWTSEIGGELESVGPSGISKHPKLPSPRALKVEEIQHIVRQFGEATRRVREAGCDGIEIHAGMGLLINQFLSPITNQRRDEYGGSEENRLRFILEILSEVRMLGGDDFTYLCRLSGQEFMDGGLTLNETTKIAKVIEAAGIDCINVQAGWHESPVPLVQSNVPPGAFIYLAEGIKKSVKIPVIAAYRITSPELAEEIISQRKADLVGMARALIADPELPKKAREGREEEIRPCIVCCRCLDRVLHDEPLYCSVNPRVGKEIDWLPRPTDRPKKVAVIGAGPSGLVCALMAASRGHKVILYEKENRLGGQLNYASVPPHKQEIQQYQKYLEGSLSRSGVRVKLKTNMEINKEIADIIIVATGAQPLIPSVPGLDRYLTALDVLSGIKTGENVLIIGGGMIGCEVAEYLASKGKKVTILEMLERVGNDIGPTIRWVILSRLKESGVKMEVKAKVTGVTEKGVVVERNGEEEEFIGDTIVVASGMVPTHKDLHDHNNSEIYIIGDAASPRRIKEAVEEGTKVGLYI